MHEVSKSRRPLNQMSGSGKPSNNERPGLWTTAQDDHLTDPLVSEEFFERLTVRDKTLRVYEGLYHEIYNEKEELRRKPLEDLRAWLEERR